MKNIKKVLSLVGITLVTLTSCGSAVDVHGKIDKSVNGWWDKNGDGKMGFVVMRGENGHVDSDNRNKYGILGLQKHASEIKKADGSSLNVDTSRIAAWEKATINDSNFDLAKPATYSNGDFVCLDVKTAVSQTGATWDAVTAGQIFNNWATTYGDEIDFAFFTDDQTLGGVLNQTGWKNLTDNNTAILGEKGFIPAVGVNAQASILPYLKNETVLGSVFNDSGRQGIACVQLADYLVHNDNTGNKDIDKITALLSKVKNFNVYEPEYKAFRYNYVEIMKDNISEAEKSDWSDEVVDKTFEGEDISKNKGKKIGFVMYNGADTNIGGNFKKAVEQQIAKLGYTANTVDGNNQQNLVQQAVQGWASDDNTAAIICNIVSQTAGQQIVDLVKGKKPLIFVNRELTSGSGVVDATPMKAYDNCFYLGTDSAQSGTAESNIFAKYFTGNAF